MTDRGSFNWLRNEKVMKIQYPKQLLIEYGLTWISKKMLIIF